MAFPKVALLGTGGSLEGEVGDHDNVVSADESTLKKYVEKQLRDLPYDFEVTSLCVAFSDHITDEEMDKLRNALLDEKMAVYGIITCGLGIMDAMAEMVTETMHFATYQGPKVILLVGSKRPLVGVTPSDGPAMLGIAIGKMDHLEDGVWRVRPNGVSKYISDGVAYRK